MTIKEILDLAKEKYGTEPEYLWKKFPSYAVLRKSKNKKWYAVIMSVEKSKLGLDGDGALSILNIKCDPITVGSLRQTEGFLPAYHMNKANWVSVILEAADREQLSDLLELSYMSV